MKKQEETRVHSHRKTRQPCHILHHDWQALPSRPPATVPRVRSSETCATLPVTGALTTMQVMEACNMQRHALAYVCTVSCLDARSAGKVHAVTCGLTHFAPCTIWFANLALGITSAHVRPIVSGPRCRPGAAQMRCGVGQWRKVLPRLQILAPRQQRDITDSPPNQSASKNPRLLHIASPTDSRRPRLITSGTLRRFASISASSRENQLLSMSNH